MPKKNKIEYAIPRLYRSNALSLLLFGYIKGARSTLHTITIDEAITMFMSDFNLTDEDINTESAKVIFNRMQKDLINLNKKQDHE